jgi:hypothetical protein
MNRWLDVSAAPRDGTPVLLWLEDDEDPPGYPVTVGVWETNSDTTDLGFWRVFGAKDITVFYFDQHVVGWMPLPPPQGRRG